MGSDNNNLDLEVSSLSVEAYPVTGLAHNPVSDFEDNKRSMLQRSLASANTLLQTPNLIQQTPAVATSFTYTQTKPAVPKTTPAVSPRETLEAVTQKIAAEEQEEENLTGWAKIGSGIANFWKSSCLLAKKALNADWKAAAVICANAVGYAAAAAWRGIKYAGTHPGEAFNLAVKGVQAAGNLLISFGKAVLNETHNLITHPVDTLKRFGSFAKSFSDQIGLTDIVMGTYHGVLAAGCLLTGDFRGVKKHALEATRAVAGAIMAIGELTGITDLGRAFIALSKGEYAKAALFGALGATQIYMICSTLGLGNLLSRQGIEAMKKGVRILAKETGQEVVEELQKKISGPMLHRLGLKISEIGESLVLRNWTEVAKDLFANVKRIISNTSEKLVEKFMRDNGAKEIVTTATDKLLEKISSSNVKDLMKEFIEEGISSAEAKYMAKCLKKGLWKRGLRSRYHGILADEIIDEITSQVKDDFMERGLRAGFERGWKESVGRILKLKGLDKEAGEILMKAGREGFEEGVELGIRKVVREGVEESFRKYRRNPWLPASYYEGQPEEISGGYLIERQKIAQAALAKKKQKSEGYKRKKLEDDESYIDLEGNVKHRLKQETEQKFLTLG